MTGAETADADAMHPDFADLKVYPGESHITAHPELFDMVNVIAFGGAADRPTHVPSELGRVGGASLWESTGAADQLPFWNTNYDGDAYLYIVQGSVRIEFKQTGGEARYGHYLARTGDLFRIPAEVAHRTFSGDGRRRITLEVVPDNPYWSTIGTREIVADPSLRAGGFSFAVSRGHVTVSAGGNPHPLPRPMFAAALRALRKYELHLGHNELDGGLSVHDLGDEVELSVPGYSERLNSLTVLGVFQALLDAMSS
jgi:mannose-6-phosphate isomerase-like protein (cupin superfamily)